MRIAGGGYPELARVAQLVGDELGAASLLERNSVHSVHEAQANRQHPGSARPARRRDRDVTFAACDVPQSVTVYGIPDADGAYSVLTLNHHLTQRDGATQNPPRVGPKLTLWVSDLIPFRVTHTTPNAHNHRDERHWIDHTNVMSGLVLTRAFLSQPGATAPSNIWAEYCLKIHHASLFSLVYWFDTPFVIAHTLSAAC